MKIKGKKNKIAGKAKLDISALPNIGMKSLLKTITCLI